MTKGWQPEERLFLHHGNEREPGGSGKRYFSRGSVKYALLELLTEEDMHGYQMMKTLEEHSGGTYKPSPGSIYPTLQMLRDQGYVDVYKQDGKRIFRITEEGRAYLNEERERPETSEFAVPGWEAGEPLVLSEQPVPLDLHHDGGHLSHFRRNRRLTPRGKELLHLLKAAERAALSNEEKAMQFRQLLSELREALLKLVEQPAAAAPEDGISGQSGGTKPGDDA
jgi:DNA-binding PadR family transcriptional regulator